MMDKTTQATMNPEQAADFAALQAAANEAEAGPAGPVAEPVQPAANLAADIAGLIKVAVATLGPMFPSLRRTYSDEVTEAAAGAIAAVCNKHGWMQGGMFGEYGEEIACLAIVGPLAFTTYQGIKQDMAEAEAKNRDKLSAPAPEAPSGNASGVAKNVTFGAPAPAEEGAAQ